MLIDTFQASHRIATKSRTVFITKAKNQFEMVEVKTGNSENGFTEITVDEKLADATFVLKGSYSLLMKIKNTTDE